MVRQPVSIVTVFNDREMRRSCLDRSIEAHRRDALDVDFVPVDNVGGRFSSAGAALNHGASLARHEHVVFVHQDVFLHSLRALEEAAGLLTRDPAIGLLGAVGVTADGRFVGRVRDRVMLLGDPAPEPIDVDCVDELLFIIPRRVLDQEPLSEDAALAWHAYAVEYGLRVRAHGLRVCAMNIPVTHNSLTGNLARLQEAYQAVMHRYPEHMPLATPQGSIGGPRRLRDRVDVFEAHRWRYRWLRESMDAHAARRTTGGAPCLLADIRLDVDALLAGLPGEPPLLVISADHHGFFAQAAPASVALTRGGRRIRLTSRPRDAIAAEAAHAAEMGPVLVTNLALRDLRDVAAQLPTADPVAGYRTSTGYWLLVGVSASAIPAVWREREATPLGMAALHA